MIYDCFTFFNELDLLEVRLEELYPVIDKFVICESNITHSGNKKPLYFLDNKDRYAKYMDKIVHLVFNKEKSDNWQYSDNWKTENDQRRFLIRGIDLNTLQDSDKIMISDVDEIPKREIIYQLKKKEIEAPVTLTLRLFYTRLTNMVVAPDGVANWRGPVIINGKILSKNLDLQFYRDFKDSFEYIRFWEYPPPLSNCGWHFSYIGNRETVIQKIESFAHQESNTEEVKRILSKNNNICTDPFDRPEFILEKVEINDNYPELIKNSPERFNHIT